MASTPLLAVTGLTIGLMLARRFWPKQQQRRTECPCLEHWRDVPTFASHPLGIELSFEKLAALAPELFEKAPLQCPACLGMHPPEVILAVLRQHLDLGDSRAAIVVSSAPLRIAAYSDELDA